MDEKYVYYWQKLVGEKELRIDLEKLKNAAKIVFEKESNNYKQKLVYNLLDTVKNNDQKTFFYILLKAINKPKENFKELWNELQKSYDLLPEDVFVNLAYSIIIGIMATYSGGEQNE